MLCPDCKTDWPEDRFNGKHPQCFRCRARSIRVGFQGGKDFFHGPTMKERQDRQIQEVRENGYEAVPAWTKTDYSGGASGMARAKTALTSEKTTING